MCNYLFKLYWIINILNSIRRYLNSLAFFQIQNYLEEMYHIPKISVSPSFLSSISLSPSYSHPCFYFHPQGAVWCQLSGNREIRSRKSYNHLFRPKCRWSPLKLGSSSARGGESAGKQVCLFFEGKSPSSRWRISVRDTKRSSAVGGS